MDAVTWADAVTAIGTFLAGGAAVRAVFVAREQAELWRREKRETKRAEVAAEALHAANSVLDALRHAIEPPFGQTSTDLAQEELNAFWGPHLYEATTEMDRWRSLGAIHLAAEIAILGDVKDLDRQLGLKRLVYRRAVDRGDPSEIERRHRSAFGALPARAIESVRARVIATLRPVATLSTKPESIEPAELSEIQLAYWDAMAPSPPKPSATATLGTETEPASTSSVSPRLEIAPEDADEEPEPERESKAAEV